MDVTWDNFWTDFLLILVSSIYVTPVSVPTINIPPVFLYFVVFNSVLKNFNYFRFLKLFKTIDVRNTCAGHDGESKKRKEKHFKGIVWITFFVLSAAAVHLRLSSQTFLNTTSRLSLNDISSEGWGESRKEDFHFSCIAILIRCFVFFRVFVSLVNSTSCLV